MFILSQEITILIDTHSVIPYWRSEMAIKVKDTPILRGKEAEAFTRTIEANKSKKVPASDYQRAQEVFRRVKLKEAE